MVIIVVAFAERYESHQPRVARAAPGGIGLSADVMAERVDAEGAVLHDNHASYAGNEERAERRRPAAPRITDRCWQRKRDGRANPVNVLVLPHDQPVSLQIDNVVKGRRRLELEKQPADVRLEKPLPNVIGVVVMINVLVMRPVLARPEQHRVFKCRRAEDQRERAVRSSAPEM